jgi:hypothetical protein
MRVEIGIPIDEKTIRHRGWTGLGTRIRRGECPDRRRIGQTDAVTLRLRQKENVPLQKISKRLPLAERCVRFRCGVHLRIR